MNSSSGRFLEYATRAPRGWTRQQTRWGVTLVVATFLLPIVSALASWQALCWASWRCYGVWRVSIIFAPATGTSFYEDWCLVFPILVAVFGPVALVILSLELIAGRRSRVETLVICGVISVVEFLVVTIPVFFYLAEEASP